MECNIRVDKKQINYNFYSMKDAMAADIDSKRIFIIANEKKKKDGTIGRYFTAFPTFNNFIDVRKKYKHCHEILIDHQQNTPDPSGRLVFDFDIKAKRIPDDFNRQIENTVLEVVDIYMKNVDATLFEFVWSSSNNPLKFSKHLTVKNMYFDDWITMSKIFYTLFSFVWDSKYFWINSRHLIDFQIVKNKASLRMVGSSKIGGNILTFDNDKYTLPDSLIRIYDKRQRKNEQLVTNKNIIESAFDDVLCDISNKNVSCITIRSSNDVTIQAPIYDNVVYKIAYELYDEIQPNTFTMGKINGTFISLFRKKSNKCLMSGCQHDADNAYITITKNDDSYYVRFGCHRKCNAEKKTIYLGSIDIADLSVTRSAQFKKISN